jgi:hypothetical protein
MQQSERVRRREEGWYWVRAEGHHWEPALWTSFAGTSLLGPGIWNTFDAGAQDDRFFERIDGRIRPPLI